MFFWFFFYMNNFYFDLISVLGSRLLRHHTQKKGSNSIDNGCSIPYTASTRCEVNSGFLCWKTLSDLL